MAAMDDDNSVPMYARRLICFRPSRAETQSPASANAEASSQPRTGTPLSSAITVPNPSARSRQPSMRANWGSTPPAFDRPVRIRAAGRGAATATAPKAIRVRARVSASVVSSMRALFPGSTASIVTLLLRALSVRPTTNGRHVGVGLATSRLMDLFLKQPQANPGGSPSGKRQLSHWPVGRSASGRTPDDKPRTFGWDDSLGYAERPIFCRGSPYPRVLK
jgi:hypothetical protein